MLWKRHVLNVMKLKKMVLKKYYTIWSKTKRTGSTNWKLFMIQMVSTGKNMQRMPKKKAWWYNNISKIKSMYNCYFIITWLFNIIWTIICFISCVCHLSFFHWNNKLNIMKRDSLANKNVHFLYISRITLYVCPSQHLNNVFRPLFNAITIVYRCYYHHYSHLTSAHFRNLFSGVPMKTKKDIICFLLVQCAGSTRISMQETLSCPRTSVV